LRLQGIASDRYRVEQTLGHGGMASVYLARDRELDRPVAVKVLAEQFVGDDAFRRRFMREGRLAARLSHANVVQVYDTGEEDGRPFIVMEYVSGETLADVLARRRKLPVREAVGVGRQAALGLEHAHAAGLIHRDVKPQNLLIRDDGVVKIADFGIARAAEVSRLTELGTVLGTAAYLAPEQARGDEVTPAADIYSLGAVLYEVLTGRTPHEFSSLADLAEKQRSGEVVPVRDLEPGVPENVEALVMRCLAREPGFRPASVAEIASALDGAATRDREDATVVAATRPLSIRTSHARTRRRRGAWPWVVAIVLAALGLALGLSNIGGGHGSAVRKPQRTSPLVPTIARGAGPTDEARNLSRWLRSHSR
jgi:eukaryotic-like serine/threonine-protein kinase